MSPILPPEWMAAQTWVEQNKLCVAFVDAVPRIWIQFFVYVNRQLKYESHFPNEIFWGFSLNHFGGSVCGFYHLKFNEMPMNRIEIDWCCLYTQITLACGCFGGWVDQNIFNYTSESIHFHQNPYNFGVGGGGDGSINTLNVRTNDNFWEFVAFVPSWTPWNTKHRASNVELLTCAQIGTVNANAISFAFQADTHQGFWISFMISLETFYLFTSKITLFSNKFSFVPFFRCVEGELWIYLI